jgi:hypothetical protein
MSDLTFLEKQETPGVHHGADPDRLAFIEAFGEWQVTTS